MITSADRGVKWCDDEMGRISGEPPKNLDHITELSSVLFSFKKNSVELEKKIFKLFGTAVRRLHPNCARVERVCYPRFLSDDVWSDVIALCWRAEFLWIVILSRFYSSVAKANCTLGVAVCRFSGVLLILAFKRIFWCGFCFTQFRINLRSRATSQ